MKNIQKFLVLSVLCVLGLQQKQQAMQRVWMPTVIGALSGIAFQKYRNMQPRPENQKLGIKDFPKLGVRYTKQLDFTRLMPKELEQVLQYQLSDVESIAINNIRQKKYSEKIFAGYEAPVFLQFINKELGYGVFAQRDIQAGEYIGEYTGSVLAEKNLKSGKEKDYAWAYTPSLRAKFAIDAFAEGNFTRFVNHSYNPNVNDEYVFIDGKWHIIYEAKTLIKKGQQLFVNYGPGYWNFRGVEPVEQNPTLEQINNNQILKLLGG